MPTKKNIKDNSCLSGITPANYLQSVISFNDLITIKDLQVKFNNN